jgi:hypothetical protein
MNKKEYHRKYVLFKTYGMTSQDLENLIKKQDNRCGICGKKSSKPLDIDHSHRTGKVRGLLCNGCNSGIGLFDDNIDSIKNAIDWIKKGL